MKIKMTENKQSSVEYFKEQIVDIVEDYKDGIISLNEYIIHINSAFEQAKAIHKKESISYVKDFAKQMLENKRFVNAEIIYTETFENTK